MASGTVIRVLPTHVANKIAAGEVVDRPASVTKELIENAIDAGASQIDVEIVAGGRKLVAVRDNGCGMSRDDAVLAIERQATSKIRDVDDIEKIATLGFRGEAVAAMAAVSRFRLITCHRDETVGTEVLLTGGKVREVRDAGSPTGTTIEVRDLFFNIPARKKFLRSYPTEMAHVRSCFIGQALAHPDIGMTLRIDGRYTHTLAEGSGLEDRLQSLFGINYLHNLRPVDHERRAVRVSGHISVPAFSRSDRNEQYVFVNGRVTSAPLISYAIREGYHRLLPDKRHPSVFLFIDLAPEGVDVNVHPTKREVRFRRPGDVRDTVIDALRNALKAEGAMPIEAMSAVPRDEPESGPEAGTQLTIEDLPPMPAFRYPGALGAEITDHGPRTTDFEGMDIETSAEAKGAQETESESGAPWAWCRVLGQVGGLYVVLETEDGFAMMDPHAAHERVLFERYMADVINHKVQSQNLLMPETVELQPKDAVRVRENLELFTDMGFGISEFGGDTFVIDALPAYFADTAATSILNEIAQGLERGGARGGKGRWQEASIAQAACKSSVKARDTLRLKEIEQLVVDLSRAEMPYTCPHGRPTLIFTTYKDLNRRFGRE